MLRNILRLPEWHPLDLMFKDPIKDIYAKKLPAYSYSRLLKNLQLFPGLPIKKVFYKRNSQNSHTSARVFFNKFAGLRPATLFKKSIWHRYFPVSFLKFFKNIFYTEHLRTTFSKSNRFLGVRQIWACFVSWDASASITDVE